MREKPGNEVVSRAASVTVKYMHKLFVYNNAFSSFRPGKVTRTGKHKCG
jgi:hypothetical protein